MSFSCPVVFCLELFAGETIQKVRSNQIRPTPIMRVVLVVISVLTSISLQLKDGIGAQDGDFTAGIFGRELPPDAPTKYREDYLLAPSSISPDKKLALSIRKKAINFQPSRSPEPPTIILSHWTHSGSWARCPWRIS